MEAKLLLHQLAAHALSARPPPAQLSSERLECLRSLLSSSQDERLASPLPSLRKGAMYERAATDGELEESGVESLLELLDPPPFATFADLGSGRGDALFHIAARRQMLGAIGIELVQSRHDSACSLRETLQARGLLRSPVRLVHADLSELGGESLALPRD